MIGVDTNVLLRYIVQDDDDQFRIAAAFLQNRTADDPAYVSLVVLAELVWALMRRYGYPAEMVRAAVGSLLETSELAFEAEEFLSPYFSPSAKLRGDVADHLIAFCARRAGCMATVTFDREAAESVPGMELLA